MASGVLTSFPGPTKRRGPGTHCSRMRRGPQKNVGHWISSCINPYNSGRTRRSFTFPHIDSYITLRKAKGQKYMELWLVNVHSIQRYPMP